MTVKGGDPKCLHDYVALMLDERIEYICKENFLTKYEFAAQTETTYLLVDFVSGRSFEPSGFELKVYFDEPSQSLSTTTTAVVRHNHWT